MVRLHRGREEMLRRLHHPWVYSQAIQSASPEAEAGQLVALIGAPGREPLGWGFYSPRSLIAFRFVSRGAQPPAEGWLEARLEAALETRRRLAIPSNAYRLVNAEGDGLPGLFVDVYDRTTVLQPLIRGMEAATERILAALRRLLPENRVFLKREETASRREGLSLAGGYLYGEGDGMERIEEAGLAFRVDIARGQKTGFYLDQRDNRLLLRRVAAGCRVLNLFAYTGAFSLQAAAGGAREVVSVESSARAVALARESAALNPELEQGGLRWVQGDAFAYLRKAAGAEPGGPAAGSGQEGLPSGAAQGRPPAGTAQESSSHTGTAPAGFQVVVVDPPPFARRRSELEGAVRGYTSINLLAARLLAPGGLLLSFTCSGAVSAALMEQILREAVAQAGRQAQILYRLRAAPDHPVALDHPEGEYLKGWLLRLQ